MSSTSEQNQRGFKRKRGRPRQLDYPLIREVVLKHKEKLMSVEDATVTPRTDPVWQTIFNEFPMGSKVPENPEALYTFVVNNTDKIRDKLEESLGIDAHDALDMSIPECSIWEPSDAEDELLKFQFTMTREEYLKIRRVKMKLKPGKKQIAMVPEYSFRPYEWEEPVNTKIWFSSGRKCCYQNESHYISVDGESGTIRGHCACGSQLICTFESKGDDTDPLLFTCNVTPGSGQCGVLYLRATHRTNYGQLLEHRGADDFQAELARKFKHPDHNKRAPMVRNQTVLRRVKSEVKKAQYYDGDPIIALTLMKASEFRDDIHDVSFDPFYVCYWANLQRHVYCRYLATSKAGTLYADATGGFPQKFTKINGEKTKAIFMYLAVVNCDGGQFSVGQMLSDNHDTITITHFWMRWLQSGFPKPPEVVMDSSRALVTSTILAFTKYKTIEDYADAGLTEEDSDCYIRYDVAHFIKMYSQVLATAPRRVKTFYLACLARIMKMTDKREILQSLLDLFIVGLFESNGPVEGSTSKSLCQQVKDKLFSLITEEETELVDDQANKENEGGTDGIENTDGTVGSGINDYTLLAEDDISNSWHRLALEMKEKVLNLMNSTKTQTSQDNGIEVNGYRFPSLIDRLIYDIRHLPLWTGVTWSKYGYGRLPASSASVECEVKKIKTGIFHKQKTRPDMVVKRHIEYIRGRMIIVDDHMDDLGYNVTGNEAKTPETENEAGREKSPENFSTDCEEKFGNDTETPESERAHENDYIDDRGLSESRQSEFVEELNRTDPLQTSEQCPDSFSHTIIEETSDSERESSPIINEKPRAHSSFKQNEQCDRNKDVPSPILHAENPEDIQNCVACTAGLVPRAHHCTQCNKAVHVLEGCSVAIINPEDGSEDKRLCVSCNSIKTVETNELLSTRCVENWRGLAAPKEKKSRGLYTGGNGQKIRDMLMFNKSNGLSILKSGTRMKLQPIKLEGRRYTFFHTCPFDSFFHVLLAAACDNDSVCDWMKKVPDNKMYAMVVDTKEHKMRSHTYQLRGEILINNFPVTTVQGDISAVDCQDDIRNFARKMFLSSPSFTEMSECASCKRQRKTCMEVLSLPARALNKKNFKTPFEDFIYSTTQRKCSLEGCQGLVEITDNIIGELVIFEPYWSNGAAVRMTLNSLPEEFPHPQEGFPMELMGVIEFYAPVTRLKKNSDLGHFVGVVRRGDKKWKRYDSGEDTEVPLSVTYKPNISLIFYCRK